MKCIAVMTTVRSRDEAMRVAHVLVERRLAACAHISKIDSVYRWKGVVRAEKEFRLLFKTTSDRYDAVAAAIQELHSYELPAIYAVAFERVEATYGAWIETESRSLQR